MPEGVLRIGQDTGGIDSLAASEATDSSPKASFPTLAIILTEAPSRAAATAWFAPLPP